MIQGEAPGVSIRDLAPRRATVAEARAKSLARWSTDAPLSQTRMPV